MDKTSSMYKYYCSSQAVDKIAKLLIVQTADASTECQRKIWLLERGGRGGVLCSLADTKVQDKMDEKVKQHSALKKLLLEYGYECTYMALPLEHAIVLYKTKFTELTEHLGVRKTEACTLLKKLHMLAIICLHNIIKCRRHLEACHKPGARRLL